MNRRHNILILASILCVILAVTAMFVLQRRNRSVIYRIESTIIEQNEMLRKQAERQRLLYATLFLDPKLAETGRNTIFLRLHDDMCFMAKWRYDAGAGVPGESTGVAAACGGVRLAVYRLDPPA